jgi:3-deoxy-D-manno-octulosonate 8-phosphate phosphatase (KDO 8-P phosphatase)
MVAEKSFSAIKAILFDIDGVLTDGSIVVGDDGLEIKSFYVRDGQLIRFMQQMGIVFGAISGRNSTAAEKRMKDLKIDFVRLGQKNKREAWKSFLREFSVSAEKVIYIGDDVIDLPLLQKAGISVCPGDASKWVKPYCDLITSSKGGKGVLREVIDLVIEKNGWQTDMAQYFAYQEKR